MIKKILLSTFILFNFFVTEAQNFSGQWKGEFYDKSTKFTGWGGDRCDYVLELECTGKSVTGFSYTYFTDEGKRYYTICRLQGFFDKKKKYIEVKEIERTKTNVPVELNNCFQVHKLNYTKEDSNEMLAGSWIPAPNQQGSCGYGITSLVRRNLKATYPGFKTSTSRTPEKVKWPVTKITTAPVKPLPAPIAKAKPKAPKTSPLSQRRDSTVVPEISTNPTLKNEPIISITTRQPYEKRNSNILKTITLESDKVKIDLYDNGEIDGDSISLFLNGKLLMANKRLTEKPITFTLEKDDLKDINEVVMYADNLGSIPPNTALMVVTDGVHRYEVRITSDLQKSGAIRFIKKEKSE